MNRYRKKLNCKSWCIKKILCIFRIIKNSGYKKMRVLTFTILLSLITFYCATVPTSEKENTNTPKTNSPQITLTVSDAHKGYFVDLQKDFYEDSEIVPVFETMDKKSVSVCEMFWGKRKYNKQVIHEYLNEKSLKTKPLNDFNELLPKLITGCWNFFLMNDLHPNRDFALTGKFFEGRDKECYTVGFIQPYIMHSTLNCKKLILIDTDWKILFAHYKMMKMYAENKFQSESSIDENLRSLNLSWLGTINPPIPFAKDIDIYKFCEKVNIKNCINGLLEFQKKFHQLESIELRLSMLHDNDFKQSDNLLTVVYLSNAIDRFYTTNDDFKKMLSSFNENLPVDGNAVMIYHAGGRDLFGIYELKKEIVPPKNSKTTDKLAEDTKINIYTKCRDRYLDPPSVKKIDYYFTKLDYNSKSKNIFTCSNYKFKNQ